MLLITMLAACSGEHFAASRAAERPGLGTSFGEAVHSPVNYVSFERASASPWAELALFYDDEAGVAQHAAYLGAPLEPLDVEAGDGAIAVALIDDDGRTLPGARAGDRTLVVGHEGARYRIAVRNATPARFEIVASVDGLDVIDGNPADPGRRGYIVEPHDTLMIDGFRTSRQGVAAFRFGRVAESYAARTTGDRDVGIVGAAIFTELGARADEMQLRDTADPFPARGYAQPPE
ncbi:MAG TPA: hypothetical protein VGF94_22170 [Kofleriaceae bacterium]